MTWAAIRFYLVLSILHQWHTRQVDFVLAYTQADAECEMYMEIPRGFHVDGDPRSHVLKLEKNLYGSRQAGRVWYQHLSSGLIQLGFRRSAIDECVFYKGSTVLLIYTDDGILCGPDKAEIEGIIQSLHDNFDLTDEGDIGDYLGVKFEPLGDGRVKLCQPHLIDQILADLGLAGQCNGKRTPAMSSQILLRDEDGDRYDEAWDYRSVIGKMNYLEKSTRPDISYAVHQCARFASDPKHSHAQAVKHIGRYLYATRDQGIILDPKDHSFDCYADADFAGNWNRDTARDDIATAKSRTAYIISYAGCPITWASKLQTEIALSTTEAEYIALSTCLRTAIPLMQLLDEARGRGIRVTTELPRIHCKLFEDNSGAIELATVHKMRPRTRHINLKFHHFREFYRKGLISIHQITSEHQLADLGTKSLSAEQFEYLRKRVMGW